MKKEIVFLASLVAVAAGAQTFPAGTVSADTSGPDVPIYYLAPGTKAPSTVYAELLVSAPGANSFTTVDLMSDTAGSVIYFDNGFGKGEAYYFYDGNQVVPGITPGASADFKVRAWTGAATYDAATARVESAVFTQNTAIWNGPPTTATDNPLTLAGSLTMTTTIVPEPATIALLALGGAALFFRRRQ